MKKIVSFFLAFTASLFAATALQARPIQWKAQFLESVQAYCTIDHGALAHMNNTKDGITCTYEGTVGLNGLHDRQIQISNTDSKLTFTHETTNIAKIEIYGMLSGFSDTEFGEWKWDATNEKLVWEGTPTLSVAIVSQPSKSLSIYEVGRITFRLEGDTDPDQPGWVLDDDFWDEETKTLTVNSNPGLEAYWGQTKIEHLVISDEVTNIGDSAFYDCSNITSVTFGSKVANIGRYAFFNGTGLSSIELPNSVATIQTGSFGKCGLVDVTIGIGIQSIEKWAFWRCENLSSLTCNGIYPPEIYEQTFEYCNSLNRIYVPAGYVATYRNAPVWYYYATIIMAIGGDATPQPYWVKPGDAWDEDTGTLTVNSNPVNAAYKNNTLLQHVVISDDVTSIGAEAFYNCYLIVSLTIGNNVRYIGNDAFYYCYNITSPIEIPNSVESIGSQAFYYLYYASYLKIGNGIQSIGKWAFGACVSFSSITCEAVDLPTLGEDVFYYVPKTIPLYVPDEKEEEYKEADQWKEFDIHPLSDITTGVESSQSSEIIRHKVLQGGQLLIKKNGKTFTLTGQVVK